MKNKSSKCAGLGKITGVAFLSTQELRRVRVLSRDFDLIIGIDPGVETGIAFWHKPAKKLLLVRTEKIHNAMELVRETFKGGFFDECNKIGASFRCFDKTRILVRLEDARLRKWIPKERGREYLQGAGSIKRDAQIWEDFLEDLDLDYELLAPAAGRTKWKPDYFQKLTGWTGRTSNHARDAAALVYGY